jgi:hypothetical protein
MRSSVNTMDNLKKRSLRLVIDSSRLPLKKRCFRTIAQLSNDSNNNNNNDSHHASWGSLSEDRVLLHEGSRSGGSTLFPNTLRVFPAAAACSSTPPLVHSEEPPPEGCQVMIARTQTCCRRRPCYKKSTYCKMHYQQEQQLQQLVLHPTKGGAYENEEKHHTLKEKDKVRTSSPGGAASVLQQQQQQQQDKRFTGSKGELRCSATTTRGRECAYTAVDGTRYCCMHADYATNPPPRRTSVTKQDVLPKVVVVPPVKKHKGVVVVDRVSSQVSDSSKSTGNGGGGVGKRRNTAEKLAQMHADSPYPLLSMFSSDQWGDKRVKIAVGPFEGHIGLVEKWSNGWVGVRIPQVGLHNRRSFELYIDSDEELPTDEDTSSEKEKQSIRRCISRDADTPSPLSPHPAGMRTPSPKARNGSGYQLVTPNPSAQEARTIALPKAGNLEALNLGSIPQVTPTEAHGKRVCVNTPVIASLLVAQQQHQQDGSKLNLLFGTAAADRGRRTARRPKIYEDTGMLDKKRSRKISLDTEP